MKNNKRDDLHQHREALQRLDLLEVWEELQDVEQAFDALEEASPNDAPTRMLVMA